VTPLIIAGAALGAAGTLWGNKAKAEQEALNAWFYKKQGEYALEAMRRELNLSGIRYAQLMGQQTSAMAKGGGDIGSGSSAGILATTAARALDAAEAIRKKGELESALAFARGEAAQGQADMYNSLGYNLLTGVTAGASGAMAAYNLSGVFTGSATPTTVGANATPTGGGFMQGPGWSVSNGNDFYGRGGYAQAMSF